MATVVTEDFFTYWINRLEQDLTPFIDPGTNLEMRARNRSVNATWFRRGRKHNVEFLVSREDGVVAIVDKQRMSYRSFLASPGMADLLSLAKMTLQAQKEQIFVETKARQIDTQRVAEPALTVLQETLSDENDDDATMVVMVTGEAGTGKTSVLKQLVKLQSERYVRGQTQCLYLYVNAQGRALARFNEALATELDELRANLTFHEVTPLVRSGLLVPIIDGFDELLGVGGYDDAFSSLSSFIEELDGNGQLIASARSTYYEQEFVARANKSSSLGAHIWRQVPVEILEWGEHEYDQYLELRCKAGGLSPIASKSIRKTVTDAFSGENQALRTKPFFVSRTVDLAISKKHILKGADLLDQLVDNYIERERTDKLRDRRGAPMLTNEQLRKLLVELAEEMWNQETRELDQRSAREVAEYVVLTFALPENTRRIVIERVTAFAFLQVGERQSTVAFEHEVFFSYFLAHRIAQSLAGDSALGMLLGRSALPLDSARITARILSTSGQLDRLQELLALIRKSTSVASNRYSQTQENAGTLTVALLIAACAGGQAVGNLQISDIVIPGLNLAGVFLKNCALSNVVFRRAILVDTKMVNCKADEVTFIEVTVDPVRTRLELSGIDVESQIIGLRIATEKGSDTIFDPLRMRDCLQRIGLRGVGAGEATDVRGVPTQVVALLEKFARAYLRSNPICVDDDTMKGTFKDQEWPNLQELLLRNGVVTGEYRNSKGHKRRLFLRRQVLPGELLIGINRGAAAPDSVRKFWDELEEKYSRA